MAAIQPTCAKPTKSYLAERKKMLAPETENDGKRSKPCLIRLQNAIEEYLLSLSVRTYQSPDEDADQRELGKGVMRLKVNPFGVSVARVTIGWVSTYEKYEEESGWETIKTQGEGLVQYTVLGDLAGKEKEEKEDRPPLVEDGKIESCLEKVKEFVGKIIKFIETYFIKIGVGPGNGVFTIAVTLGGLEWVYVSCLKAGEGLLTVRSLGFINKQEEE